jgi:hypothetical protein
MLNLSDSLTHLDLDQMAKIGIEYIENFAAVRAAGQVESGGQDLTYVSDVAEGLREALECKGHTTTVSWIETDVFEVDLRARSLGGIDQDVSDKVDLFFISTHGNYDGTASLLYNCEVDEWLGTSAEWRLGDTCNLEWLLIFGCLSINRDRPLDHRHIFQGLHLFCGAYSDMFDSFTIDEAGEDVGDNLTSGDSVKDAWCDGVSDWRVDNKRGVFRSLLELKDAIHRFLDQTNADPKPFTWTKDPNKIIAAVKRGHQVLDSIH